MWQILSPDGRLQGGFFIVLLVCGYDYLPNTSWFCCSFVIEICCYWCFRSYGCYSRFKIEAFVTYTKKIFSLISASREPAVSHKNLTALFAPHTLFFESEEYFCCIVFDLTAKQTRKDFRSIRLFTVQRLIPYTFTCQILIIKEEDKGGDLVAQQWKCWH